ncbi:MAG: hypothetical protein WC372_12370 [Candidatus Neomarinimicrobiota bacterium]|jgi:hypothetical protein
MNQELIQKKFMVVLERWMHSYSLDAAGLAWLLDVHTQTVKNWLTGACMPGGRNAILLSYFAEPVAPVLQKWAGVDEVHKRYDAMGSVANKAA